MLKLSGIRLVFCEYVMVVMDRYCLAATMGHAQVSIRSMDYLLCWNQVWLVYGGNLTPRRGLQKSI